MEKNLLLVDIFNCSASSHNSHMLWGLITYWVCYRCGFHKSRPRFQMKKRIPLNKDYRDKEHEMMCLAFILDTLIYY